MQYSLLSAQKALLTITVLTTFLTGLPEVFMNASSKDLKAFYKAWYIPDNMSILIVGNIKDQLDNVRTTLSAVFDSMYSDERVAYANTESCTEKVLEKEYSEVKKKVERAVEREVKREVEREEERGAKSKRTIRPPLVLPTHHRNDCVVALIDAELTASLISIEFFKPFSHSNSVLT